MQPYGEAEAEGWGSATRARMGGGSPTGDDGHDGVEPRANDLLTLTCELLL